MDAHAPQISGECLTNGYNLVSFRQTEPVELVISSNFQVFPGVPAMKSDPSVSTMQSRQPNQKMRFHGVRVNDLRLPGIHNCAQLRNDFSVKRKSFMDYIHNHSGCSGGRNKMVVMLISPCESNN